MSINNGRSTPMFNVDDESSYPPIPAVIVPGILYEHTLTTLWGAPESGKSHVAIDLACTIAQTAPVVYVAAEAPFEIAPRAKAWKTYHELDCFNRLHIWTNAVWLMDEVKVRAFISAVAPLAPRAVFFDPLAQCFMGGDESSAKDMCLVNHHLNWICEALNAGIIVIHHTGWDQSRERGSSALRGANRVSYSIGKTAEGRVKLSCEKLNAGRKPTDRYFTIAEVGSEMETVLLPASREPDPTQMLSPRQMTVLTVFAMSVFEHGTTRKEAADLLKDHGIPAKTSYRIITSLIDLGMIDHFGANQIHVSEMGKVLADEFSRSHSKTPNSHPNSHSNLNWSLTPTSPILTDSQ